MLGVRVGVYYLWGLLWFYFSDGVYLLFGVYLKKL